MTLQELITQYETPNRPMSKDEADRYIAAKQAVALEEIALQLRYIEETLRHNPNS